MTGQNDVHESRDNPIEADQLNLELRRLQLEIKDLEHKTNLVVRYGPVLLAAATALWLGSNQLHTISELRAEVARLANQRTHLSEEKKLLANEVDNLDAELGAARTSIKITNLAAAESSLRAREAAVQLASTHGELEQARTELTSLAVDRNTLHDELTLAQSLLEQKQRNLDVVERELDRAMAVIGVTKSAFKDYEVDLFSAARSQDRLSSAAVAEGLKDLGFSVKHVVQGSEVARYVIEYYYALDDQLEVSQDKVQFPIRYDTDFTLVVRDPQPLDIAACNQITNYLDDYDLYGRAIYYTAHAEGEFDLQQRLLVMMHPVPQGRRAFNRIAAEWDGPLPEGPTVSVSDVKFGERMNSGFKFEVEGRKSNELCLAQLD